MRRHTGFSLVEVLVAIVVAGIVLAAALLAFHSANRTANTQRSELRSGDPLALAVDHWMADAVSGAPLPGADGRLLLEPGPPAALRWATYEPVGATTSRWMRAIQVEWRVAPGPDNTPWLWRAHRPLTGPAAEQLVSNRVVGSIAEFSVEAYDGTDWHLQWDTATEDETVPGFEGAWPRALRLQLELEDGQAQEIRVFLPVGHRIESDREGTSGEPPTAVP